MFAAVLATTMCHAYVHLSCKLKSINQISPFLYVFCIGWSEHWLAESFKKLLVKCFLVSVFMLANKIRNCRTRELILIFLHMKNVCCTQHMQLPKCHLFRDLYGNITNRFYYVSLKKNDQTTCFHPKRKYFTKAMFRQCS